MIDLKNISIIIPVYNDETGIVKCLDALANQSYPKENFEIIVVDNGSSDQSIQKAKSYSGVTVLIENQPGSYSARNKGIKESNNPVLAFLDADCIADSEWLSEGIKALKKIKFEGLVGGNIEFTFNNPDKPKLTELFDSITYLNNKRNIEEFDFAVTANMFTTRKIFNEVGNFNSVMKSGGDREWGGRVKKHGKSAIFSNDAVIYHHARDTYSELITKTRRVIAGVMQLEKRSANKTITFLLELIPPIKRSFNIIRNQKLARLDKRLALVTLAYFLKLVGAFELLRFSLGFSVQR